MQHTCRGEYHCVSYCALGTSGVAGFGFTPYPTNVVRLGDCGLTPSLPPSLIPPIFHLIPRRAERDEDHSCRIVAVSGRPHSPRVKTQEPEEEEEEEEEEE